MNRPTPELPTLEQVGQFVKENTVEANNDGLACGDGRYAPGESKGMIRIFGGDFGPMLAYADAVNKREIDISNDDIISANLTALKETRGEEVAVYLHSDTHHEEEGGIGCGHANQASLPENEGEYGLSSSSAKDLFEKTLKRPEAEKLVLTGTHQEKAVLLVFGDENGDANYSVNSQDEGGDSMYFVVDMDRIKKHLERIGPIMSKTLGVGITPKEVFESYLKQQEASRGHLAKDLSVFNVAIDSSGKATVAQAS